MTKILYCIYGLNVGGAETFVYNIMTHLDYSKYHVDFALQDINSRNCKLLNYIREKNCNVFYLSRYTRNPIKFANELSVLLVEGKYDIIHYHVNSLVNILPILVAKKNNIRIIIHSHSTSSNAGLLGNMIHYINRMCISQIPIQRVACGEKAGEWLYGKKEFQIIPNGIDTSIYEYNTEYRLDIRKEYKIPDDDIVIGHVGRFAKVKNHIFLVECFAILKSYLNCSKLLLVGDGETKKEIEELVYSLGLSDAVYFAGEVDDTYKYFSAMDICVFPSLYEGVPFALIEAQASGVPILASDSISDEAKITDLVHFLSLEDKKCWVEKIIELINQNNDRSTASNKIKKSKYDIEVTIEKMEEIYDRD